MGALEGVPHEISPILDETWPVKGSIQNSSNDDRSHDVKVERLTN